MRATGALLIITGFLILSVVHATSNVRRFNGPEVGRARHWEMAREKVELDVQVTWKVYLKLRNTEKLARMALEVADPSSESYGKLVDLEYIQSEFNPTAEQLEAVLTWIQNDKEGEHRVVFVPRGREYIRLMSSVGDLERLFDTKFGLYRSLLSERLHLRPVQSYAVPAALIDGGVIDYIDQFSELPNQAPKDKRSNNATSEYQQVDPAYLYKAYQITEATSAVRGSSSATVQFSGNWYSPTDLQTFFKQFVPAMAGQTPSAYYGVNSNPPPTVSKPSLESNLDQQYIMGVGNFVNSSIYYVVASGGIEEGFVEYATFVNNQNEFPLVQSISYGQYGGQYTNATVQRLDGELQKAGLRGYTGLLASGDNGVGGKCQAGQCVSFEFDFPSSPHFTMVGATQFMASNGEGQAAQLSAGGFSLDYSRPSWQESAVQGYFNSGVALPSSSLYDANGRGYPDIAAAGQDVVIVDQGAKTAVSGTSCSAPITGGIFALLNNYRIANGKSPLGWLNPLLYANPSAFTDILVGNNKYCRLSCCCPGFTETVGWSPVTGLGSPNYQKLLAVVKALP